MAKHTFGLVVAGCGHTYHGYENRKPWRYCADCMRSLRSAMKAETERLATLRPTSERRPRFKPSRKRRLAIYERDGWVCQLCFDPVDSTLPPTDHWAASLDHIICQSWSERPDHSDANLRLAHRICNARRSDEGHWAKQYASREIARVN